MELTAQDAEFSTPWGHTLLTPAGDRSRESDLLETGISCPYELEVLRSVVKAGMTIVDVGASYGYLSSYLASLVGDGKIIAIEPEPNAFEYLARNIERNQLDVITPRNCAAGAQAGYRGLWRSATKMARHSFAQAAVPDCADTIRVPVLPLDGIFSPNRSMESPDLLKLDCEGWEAEVLAGSRGILRRCRPLVWMEFWPDGLRAAGADPTAPLEMLSELGYSINAFDIVEGRELDIREPVRDLLKYCDSMAQLSSTGKLICGIAYILGSPS